MLRQLLCGAVLSGVLASGPAFAQEPDYSAELPKIPPKTPEESLKCIKLKAGFHAELVATEPLVRSPMAMDFDEYGRAFVVELPEYNQYGSSKPHGKGAIKLLEDTNGDGRFDKAKVYVDDLNYPTSVACWDGGIVVGVAPDLLYCKDTDGDGKADVRKVLFTGFGQDKAGEGMLNSFRWRIDNKLHVPTGLDGGSITLGVDHPAVVNGLIKPSEFKPINARGQHLLLDPRTLSLEATSGGGQHGMSFDDWSLRAFVCGNSEPVHLVMYDGRYLARNPYLTAPAAAINIAPEGKFTKLMRISAIEPWRILRTRLRKAGTIPGSDEGGTPAGFFTGATGITVYRGDAWPAEYRGQVFVGEVANNLVYRARLQSNGVGLTAHRADVDAEFLASSDNWFRPVQFANAPDGTLYVIDMSRELIEGAAFLAPQILKHMDASAGANMGRIYRIAPDGFQFKSAPRIGDLPTVELVKLLEHRNAWHRETAARLIHQRQDRAASAPLRELSRSSASELARTFALHALRGLRALNAEDVLAALSDGKKGDLARPIGREGSQIDDLRRTQAVASDENKFTTDGRGRPSYNERANALIHLLRLAELFPDQAVVRDAAISLSANADIVVRYQAAFTLGAFQGEPATQALLQLAIKDGADSWMQTAILSSIGNRRAEFLALALRDPDARKLPHVRQITASIAAQIGAANAKDELAAFVKLIESLSSDAADKAVAEELVKSLVSKQPSAKDLLASATSGKAKEIVAAMIRDAQAVAADEKKSVTDRVSAIRTLSTAEFNDVQAVLAKLLQSREPQAVQSAALETLGRFDQSAVPKLIFSAWPSQTPQVRATAIETLFARPKWIVDFLNGVELGVIARADIDPARVILLQQHNDASIRDRAKKLFAGATLARRQEVVDAYQKSLELKGDVDRGRLHFRKTCAACHKLEGVGEQLGADLNAIKDRGTAAVLLNILDPNREVKPQFLTYVIAKTDGRTLSGLIIAETANSLTLRKADNTSETVLRVDIEELKSTGLSFMPEGLEKQLSIEAMADLLAYLNSIK